MKILVIEDEPDLLSALVQSLREAGYAVDSAEDGEEGLFKAAGGGYDAVVLDMMLPRIDGWALLGKLRKTDTVPVLALTARDALPDRVRGLDAGADGYLTKPFELAELLARLRAIIRRSAGKASTRIDLGDISIDIASRNVRRAGQLVPLTPREYALVEYLALHKGTLVTRTVIYDHLFGEEDDTLSNLVDVHVSNVRKKLGKEFIITRRGEGYLIDA